jgi:cold shock CspA family protein
MGDTYERRNRDDFGNRSDRPKRPRNNQPAEVGPDGRVSGTIKNTTPGKGYGFVSDKNNFDYFFHYSALPEGTLLEHLYKDQAVSWEPTVTDKGPRAEKIQIGE